MPSYSDCRPSSLGKYMATQRHGGGLERRRHLRRQRRVPPGEHSHRLHTAHHIHGAGPRDLLAFGGGVDREKGGPWGGGLWAGWAEPGAWVAQLTFLLS